MAMKDEEDIYDAVSEYRASLQCDAKMAKDTLPIRLRFYRPNIDLLRQNHDANQMRSSPNDPQFDAVLFSDGKVVVRWLTSVRSVSVFDSLDDLLKIHGHSEYGTCIMMIDALPPDVEKCLVECGYDVNYKS